MSFSNFFLHHPEACLISYLRYGFWICVMAAGSRRTDDFPLTTANFCDGSHTNSVDKALSLPFKRKIPFNVSLDNRNPPTRFLPFQLRLLTLSPLWAPHNVFTLARRAISPVARKFLKWLRDLLEPSWKVSIQQFHNSIAGPTYDEINLSAFGTKAH